MSKYLCCDGIPRRDFLRIGALADKYVILRGVSHNLAAHELGLQYLDTGNRPGPALRYPSYGSVVARNSPRRRSCRPSLPSRARAPTRPVTSAWSMARLKP